MIIITKKPRNGILDLRYYISKCKYFLKNILQGKRGPQTVINNLLKGLNKLDANYQLNPHTKQIENGDTVYVLRDIWALKEIISLKQKGLDIEIIAGPNIVTIPTEENNLILDENIDQIIVPSQWVYDLYKKFTDRDNIKIWPVGIETDNVVSQKNGVGLVYKKNIPENKFDEIITTLKSKNIEYKIIEYGKFKQEEYFELLSSAPWMIYLQEIESQGLSLFEAWSYDVPTLVWNNNFYQYPNKDLVIEQDNIAAPYLSNESGLYFKNDFNEKFKEFISNLGRYTPKKYVSENFSLKKSARKLIEISKQHG
jgi:hypothetical protein